MEKIRIFNASTSKIEEMDKIKKNDDEWKKILTDEQFRITRKKGTEPPSKTCTVGIKNGIYKCVCCGIDLFEAKTRFDSGTGWPSFFKPVSNLNLREVEDRSQESLNTEVLCARCEAHLGHVFNDGPPPTYRRYCINSIALKNGGVK